MRVVAITGANGFVGRGLCRHLVERGWSVRAIVRGRNRHPELALDGVQIVPVQSLEHVVGMRSALEGAQAIVHLAGLAHALNAPSAADFDRVNHTLAVAVARLAAAAHVKRLVLLSTIKVNGEATASKPFAADDLPAPQDDYARSKLQAERALLAIAPEIGLEPVIVRPPLVYGPGVRANFERLVRLVRTGWPLPLGDVDNRRTMVNVGNLNSLIQRTLEHPAAPGATFLAGDARPVSTPELIRLIAAAMGRTPRLVVVPEQWIRAGARLAGKQELASRLLDSLEVSVAEARNVLGWEPPVSVEDGIAQTVASIVGAQRR